MEVEHRRKFFYEFLKLIFRENLHRIYRDIYDLVRVLKFTPEYVENMSPAERDLMWVYYKNDEKEKQKLQNAKKQSIPTIGGNIDNNEY